MLVKVKALNILTGRPIAILPTEISKWLNIHVGDRVLIKKYGEEKEVVAIVDVAQSKEKVDYIFVSNEIFELLKLTEGNILEINPAQKPLSVLYIKEKMDKKRLNYQKIYEIIKSIARNELNEAEVAYFVASSYINGMNFDEIVDLTKAMVEIGNKIKFNTKYVLDKHCIGGIPGNRTTPIVTSIIAAAIKELKLDAVIPKTSSRAITSASGTADVIELITNVEFDIERIKKIVNKVKACLVWGGALGISPADDKIIQVERLLNLDPKSQLIASIMSKKISVGSNVVLVDIPYGKGAKVSTIKEANELKKSFEQMGKKFNMKVKAVLTNGEQPIGNGIGPMLELIDVLTVLKNSKEKPIDLYNKSLFIARNLLSLIEKDTEEIIRKLLENGKAYEAFKKIIEAQGGEVNEKKLVTSSIFHELKAEKNGKIVDIDNKKINFVARVAGCPIDKLAGIYIVKHVNDKVEKNETYAKIYAETEEKLQDAVKIFNEVKPIIIK